MPLTVIRRGRYYHVHGTHHGVKIRRSAKTTDRRVAEQVKESIEREIHAQVVLGKPRSVGFAEAVEAYLERGEDRFMIAVLDAFRDMPVDRITQADLDRKAREAYPDAKPSTLNRQFYTPAIAVLRYAARQGWCPMRDWDRPKQPEGRTDWRTPEEMERLIEAAPLHVERAVIVYLGTMLRASEGVRLDARDVASDGSQVTLWETKGGYARHVEPLTRAREELAGLPAGRVLRNARGDPWHAYDALNLALGRAAAKAGVAPLSLHVLRHTGATWRYALDPDLPRLQAAGGWKSVNLVMRYVHAATRDLPDRLRAHGWTFEHT